MSNQFDWNSFEGVTDKNIPSQSQAEQPTQDFFSQYETLPSQEGGGFSKVLIETPKGLGRIAGRSAASLLAAPSKSLGGIARVLGSVPLAPEEESTQFAKVVGQSSKDLMNKIGDYLEQTGEKGQNFLNQQLEKLLGTSYSKGEESLARVGERGADIYGRGPFKGMGTASAIGGVSGQVAEELGAPPEVQSMAEIVGIMGPDLRKAAKALTPKSVTEKSGLVLPKIVEKTKEGFKIFKPKALSGAKEKSYAKVSEDASKLINKMKSQSMPISKQIEEGIDVGERLTKQFEEVQKIAAELPTKIESNYVSDYLNEIGSKIKEVPVPTKEQEQILSLVDKFQKSYGAVPGGVRYYSPNEYVKQFRNINKDAKKLYETQLLEGKQLETIGFYEGLKGEIAKTLENGTPKEFSELFKQTNKQFAELSNLEKFETILQDVSKDGVLDSNKLAGLFKSQKKTKFLKRSLGEEGFNNLKEISNDLSKVKNKLNLVQELGLSQYITSGLTYGLLSKFGLSIPKAAHLSKKGIELAQGYMLLNPKGSRDVNNFLKALKSGNEKAIKRYLTTLDKNAKSYEESLMSPDEQSAEEE